MKNYLVNIDDPQMNGGQKAKNDITRFLTEDGFFSELNIPIIIHPEDKSLKAQIKKFKDGYFTLPHEIKKIKDADNIVFQYPIYSAFIMKRLIPTIKKYTNAKLIFVIHDIEGIRMFQDNNYHSDEINLFNEADGIISHNQAMTDWLTDNQVHAKLVNLQLFDYYNPQPLNENTDYHKSIVFAGNLKKSTFLTKLSLKHPVTLYGPNPADHYLENVTYKKNLDPDELPAHLTQDFGLVWDGTSTETCDGTYGHYLKYNNPHKTSLYLSSGIPVIIWKQAALASFIEENNLGITVDNLNELNDILDNLTEEQYREMKQNVLQVATKLRSGYFIKHAMKSMFNELKENK